MVSHYIHYIKKIEKIKSHLMANAEEYKKELYITLVAGFALASGYDKKKEIFISCLINSFGMENKDKYIKKAKTINNDFFMEAAKNFKGNEYGNMLLFDIFILCSLNNEIKNKDIELASKIFALFGKDRNEILAIKEKFKSAFNEMKKLNEYAESYNNLTPEQNIPIDLDGKNLIDKPNLIILDDKNIIQSQIECIQFSRFNKYSSDNNLTYSIKEAELNTDGVKNDFNNMKYEHNIKSNHAICSGLKIKNFTDQDIYISINGGNIFKIDKISPLNIKDLKEKYISIWNGIKIIYHNDSDNYRILSSDKDVSITKPVIIETKILEKELEDQVYILPELNLYLSFNKKELIAALHKQNILDRYRVENLSKIVLSKSKINDIKWSEECIFDLVSQSNCIMINDPYNKLYFDLYTSYFNNKLTYIYSFKNTIMKEGVYFVTSKNDKTIIINKLDLETFHKKLLNSNYITIHTNETLFVIAKTELGIQQYIKEYNINTNLALSEEILQKAEECEKLSKEIIEYKNNLQQKEKEITNIQIEKDSLTSQIKGYQDFINSITKNKKK